MARWPELDAYLRARGIRVGTATLGQTTGGTHATGSYHYLGLARDFGLYNCDCAAIAAALRPLAQGQNYCIVELIWQPAGPISGGTFFKNGGAYTPTTRLSNGHRDHVHAAIRPGANLPAAPPLPGDDVNDGDITNIANAVYAKLGPNAPGFDLGDTVNTIVAAVNAHIDAKIAEAIAALKT